MLRTSSAEIGSVLQCDAKNNSYLPRFLSTRYFLQKSNKKKVVYPVPATGTRSPCIAYRQSAINNSLAPKPTPKPNPNPTSNPTLP